jgi:hypothetical protein
MGLGSDENRVPIIGTEVSNIGGLTHICPLYRVLIGQARLYRFRIAASKCRHQLNRISQHKILSTVTGNDVNH